MLPPNLDHEPMRLLLPSVLGMYGLAKVFVEADVLKDGIIEILRLFTLADRASEAFVGVVTALGRAGTGLNLTGIDCVFSSPDTFPRESGLAVEVSSLCARFARFPDAVFSRRSVALVQKLFKDFERGSDLGISSRPAFDGLRFKDEDAVSCSLCFQADA